MNYFYSFCNRYNYITINEFKSIFHDKMGNFIVIDNDYLMTKLYNYCNGKLSEFIQVLKNVDANNIGKINLHDFIKGLKEKNLIFRNINQGNIVEPKDINDIIQLLIIHMKKNKDKKNEVKSNKNANTNTNTNKKESNKNLKEATKKEMPELKKNINANSNANNKIKENELLSKLNNRKGLNNIPPKKELNNKANDNNNFLLEIRKKLKKVSNTNTQSNETKQSNIKNIDPNTEYEE
jgi:hypothetical protein